MEDIDDKFTKMSPVAGEPLSAVISSIWPQEMLQNLRNSDEYDNTKNYIDLRCDEFGFRIEDNPRKNSNKLLDEPFIEDKVNRLQWINYLEFTYNSNDAILIPSQTLSTTLPRTEKLVNMVRAGIPHSLRSEIWMRLSGALKKKTQSEMNYEDIVKLSSVDEDKISKQIEKDLLRIMPSNICFSSINSPGIPRLRRILRSIAWLFPEIGYCQGTGIIVASLLLFLEEEDSFWIMVTTVEDLLPASYYSSTLLGVQTDQKVMQSLIGSYLPVLNETLKNHDIELSLITLHWFVTLFAGVVHIKILLRIWDWFFYDGSIVVFQIILGMLKINQQEIINLENSAQIFNLLSDMAGDIYDIEQLITMSLNFEGSIIKSAIETHRRRHLAYLMTEQGALVGQPKLITNLPKQQLIRQPVKKNHSLGEVLLFGVGSAHDDFRSKNIKQTELLVDLRESISQVARHFLAVEPKLSAHIKLIADYSMDSHTKDHQDYINLSKNRKRRAKALHDFERHDDDELGFRKNDIIRIISQKDEHCWIGELNGLRGWFPAKFVEVLDERSKQYSSAGDDAISKTVTDLVRGMLAPAIKQVLEHGMKQPNFLGGPCHPWLFIEEAASREVEKDFNSVYSRLVLCKTYRLDEDGKVLTAEELLFRCVQLINQSHDNEHAQMDIKLRSLVCLGLNEQVLHLWLEVFCSCIEIVQKWYHSWSFINSPGWVQIKCELRILSQFAFNLNPDWELPAKKITDSQPLQDGVRDMLVKHHLFSWDI